MTNPGSEWQIRHPEDRVRYREMRRLRSIRKRAILKLVKMTAGCADCGYSDNPEALDFDHVEDKSFTISQISMRGWPTIWAEVAKCEVVCANCHRERTYERRNAGY